MDGITHRRIETIHPRLRLELRMIYSDICARLTGKAVCRFSQVLRSFKEQDDLYAQGRSRPGKKVTNARGGQSYHNYGLAVDIVLILNGREAVWDIDKDFDSDGKADWMEVVEVFRAYGWEWGGDWLRFKDYPHFEKTFGLSTGALLQRHLAGKKDAEGYVIL